MTSPDSCGAADTRGLSSSFLLLIAKLPTTQYILVGPLHANSNRFGFVVNLKQKQTNGDLAPHGAVNLVHVCACTSICQASDVVCQCTSANGLNIICN